MALISYSLFAAPARFNYYFGDGLLFTTTGVLISIANDKKILGAMRIFVLAIYTLLQLAIILPFVFMVALYFLSIKAMWEYSRVRDHGRSEKDRRNQLISVLLYCTPPNLLNILVIVISIFQLHVSLTGAKYPEIYYEIRTIQWYSEKVGQGTRSLCILMTEELNYRGTR
uniref:G_PROTEIN_RECEP_F1_2 domain-containing protein n=1 Tax=Steinernema glaseri TaxID=37863 RepID=A0A1I7YUF2_9BILA